MKSVGRTNRVVVVGGGITGLAAAHRMTEIAEARGERIELHLLESSGRVGGLVRTHSDGPYLFEDGPDTLVAGKPAAVNLAERLGLAAEIQAVGGTPGGTEVVRRGKLVRIPEGFMLMAPSRLGPTLASPLLSARAKLRLLYEPFIPARPWGEDGDESLASFVTRRMGREVLDRIAEPVIGGLFTARAEDLSLRLTLPRFLELEQREGSLVRGLRRSARKGRDKTPFVTLTRGLASLTRAIEAHLPEGAIRMHAPVAAIKRESVHRAWGVRTVAGETFLADAVVLTCPAPSTARIMGTLDPELAERLGELEYASCATVSLVYGGDALAKPLRSYGFFVPRGEKLPILACSHVSVKFPARVPEGMTLLRVFLGGAGQPEALEPDDEALAEMAHDSVARLLRLRGAPVLRRVTRFPESMPQYRVGQGRWIGWVRERTADHQGLFLAGSSVGARGLPDCVASGEEAAEAALRFVSERREPVRVTG